MALIYKDRVKETSTTTGTGTLTLAGAASGYRAFSVVGDGNTCAYCIEDADGTSWEVGIGTYTLSGTTLARTTVLANDNGDTSAITLSSGTHTVFLTRVADYLYRNGTLFDMGEQVKAHSTISANTDLDADEGHLHTLTISGASAYTITPKNTTAHGYTAITVLLTTTSSASGWSWGGTINWSGGSAPDLSADDTYLLFFHFVGSTVYGVFGGAV